MRKKLTKHLAFLMAALMILTSINPMTVSAASMQEVEGGYASTYSLTELTNTMNWNASVTADGTDTTIAYTGNYQQAFFAIPAEVLAAGVTKFSVGFAAGSSAADLALKFANANGDELSVGYRTDSLAAPADFSTSEACIDFMSLAEDASSYTVSTVTFYTANAVEGFSSEGDGKDPAPDFGDPVVNVTDTMIEISGGITLANRWNGSDTQKNIVSFGSQYNEYVYTLPEAVDFASVKNVVLDIENQEQEFAVKLYDEAMNEVKAAYGLNGSASYTVAPNEDTEGKLAAVAVMSNPADVPYPYSITVKKITVNLQEPAADPEETPVAPDFGDPVVNITDTMIQISGGITLANRWNDSDTQKNIVSFGSQYNEYVYYLPEAVDFASVTNVVLDIENQEQEFSVKFYDEAMKEVKAQYGLNGSASYTVAPNEDTEGALAAVAVMSNPADVPYPYSITVKKITVNKTASAPVDDKKMELSGDLNFHHRWSNAPMGNTISYSGVYDEYILDLPQEVDMSKIISVSFEVENQGGKIACKLYDSGYNELQTPDYGVEGKDIYTIAPTGDGKLAAVAFMSMVDADYSVTIKNVIIECEPGTLAPIEDLKTEITDIQLYGRHDNVPVGGNTATFEEQWNEVAFDLPEPIDLEKLDNIVIKVSNQQGAVTFKLYNADKSSELAQFWTQSGKTSYTLTTTSSGICTSIGVMAHNPSNAPNEYPFSITIESATVKMLPDDGEETVEKGVEYDLYDLRDKVGATVGSDFRIGTAISYQEFADSMEMELVTKHFNSVTLGNELKPDSMLKAGAEKQEVTINGQTILFPVLDYSNPERYLDFFVAWNAEHPEKQIKIRGHVLTWHSQTPEWFFHEDYDSSKPYVSPEVMSLRHEYYIKSVAEHFTGAGSKYAGMFYGWDVVNEAVSDSTGTYRNDSESSSWWAVYQSPEFITNAFVFANKYFPADVELYYNDYNETSDNKSKGIAALLTAVKNTPGARIDACGMQGHYQISDNPTIAQFTKAARLYAGIVGAVQVTELDFKGATSSTDERLTARYKDFYDAIRRLKADNVNVTGMTIWGVVDKHSWLQTANGAGGGSTTNSKQYPLLFDNNYKAKGAFYAIAEAGFLAPEIKTVTVVETKDGSFTAGNTYTLKNGATFVPVWDAEGLKVKVTVPDTTVDESDRVYVYSTMNGGAFTAAYREDVTVTADGYEAVLTLYGELTDADKMDVVVVDGETAAAFNDTTFSQFNSDEYYAEMTLTKSMTIDKGTVTIDGDASDAAWSKATSIPLTISLGANVTADAKALWDENNLYVLVNVNDSVLNKASSDAYQQDSLELFIDENNHKSDAYEADDKQYRVNFDNEQSFNGQKCNADNIVSATALTETGYMIEAAFKWTDIAPAKNTVIGLEFQINDADASGKRAGTLSWNDTTGTGYACPGVFGTAVLVDTTPAPVVTPVPAPAPAPAPVVETVTQEVIETYTVVSGDSLYKIAKKYGVSVAELAALNPEITNINRIYPGQQIIIRKTTAEVPADQANTSETAPEKEVYIVRRGDNLTKIARKYKLTLKQLLALNAQIKNPNKIYPGQKIYIEK